MKPSDVNKAVGAALCERRKALRLSQASLGAVANVGRSQVQKYERGTNRVPADALLAFARCLDVPVAYFFAACDSEAEREARLCADIRALTPDQRRAIAMNIRAFAKGGK